MLKKHLCGRAEEQKKLKKLIHSEKAEFIAVYGRRRIGKTFLIKEFFKLNHIKTFYVMGENKAKTNSDYKVEVVNKNAEFVITNIKDKPVEIKVKLIGSDIGSDGSKLVGTGTILTFTNDDLIFVRKTLN